MIGAGAVVLPDSRVPDGTLVAAATRFPAVAAPAGVAEAAK